jgi:hypothetical protein
MILRRATATVFVSIGVATALLQGCAASDPAGTGGSRSGGGASTGSGTGSGGSSATGSGGTTGSGGSFGTGGTFGTGGGINPGNPDATADMRVNLDAACAAESVKGERRPTDLYMMMDNSGSMDMKDNGATLSRWDNLAQAIPTFVNDPANAGMEVGLDFFPEGGVAASCNIADYTMANVPIDFLPGMNNSQANAIVTAVQGRARSGGTPTVPALSGALQAAKAWQMNNPSRSLSVLFLTDGQPTGCTGNSVPAAAQVAQMYATGVPPIRTYVLGVGPDTGNLDAIAAAGGTMMAYMVTNGGAAELAKALAAIRKSTLSCDYNIPKKDGGVIDTKTINVQVRVGPNGAPVDIYNVDTVAGCSDVTKNPKGEGWYFDVLAPGTPTKIILCPNSCGPLQVTDGSEIGVVIGCPTVPIPPPH